MPPPRAPREQLDLLAWKPPVTVARFADEQVRAATLNGQMSRAIAAALKDCGMSRADVAKCMSAYLGQQVSKHMLDGYASQTREDHSISAVRLVALLHATRDRRLLELIAEMFGWAVIERKHLPLIEMAALQEKTEELKRQQDALRRQARAAGGL